MYLKDLDLVRVQYFWLFFIVHQLVRQNICRGKENFDELQRSSQSGHLQREGSITVGSLIMHNMIWLVSKVILKVKAHCQNFFKVWTLQSLIMVPVYGREFIILTEHSEIGFKVVKPTKEYSSRSASSPIPVKICDWGYWNRHQILVCHIQHQLWQAFFVLKEVRVSQGHWK